MTVFTAKTQIGNYRNRTEAFKSGHEDDTLLAEIRAIIRLFDEAIPFANSKDKTHFAHYRANFVDQEIQITMVLKQITEKERSQLLL